MKTIAELNNELNKLQQQKIELETQLKDAIYAAMIKAANSDKAPKKLSNNFLVVQASDLFGNTWNPEFYNWEEAAECIYAYLENKDPNKWIDYLKDKMSESKDKHTIVIEKRSYGNRTYRVPVPYKLVEEIIYIINEISK